MILQHAWLCYEKSHLHRYCCICTLLLSIKLINMPYWFVVFLHFRVDLTEEVFGRRSKSRGWPRIVPTPSFGGKTTTRLLVNHITSEILLILNSRLTNFDCKTERVSKKIEISFPSFLWRDFKHYQMETEQPTNKPSTLQKSNHHTPSMP